jgi:hypothetical protein
MPIELYCGMLGAGKTYAMVRECIIPALASPQWEVLSNVDVTHPKSGRRTVDVTNGREIDFTMVQNLIDANLALSPVHRRNLLLAVDEIGLAMPQEMWKSDDAINVIALVLQLRKARCDFVGTVQHFERAVKVLRDNTNTVHLVRVYARQWWPWGRRDVEGPMNRKTGRAYKLPWLFEIESVTAAGVGLSPDSPMRKRHRVGWRKLKFDWSTARAYDTYQRVAPKKVGGIGGGGVSEDDAEYLAELAARRVIDERVVSGGVLALPVESRRRRGRSRG